MTKMNSSDEFDKELKVVDAIYNEEGKSEDESVSLSSISDVEDYQNFADGLDAVDLNSSRFNIVEFEESIEDKDESKNIESMYGENSPPCCSKKCNKVIPESIAIESRGYFQEMSKTDQDLV